jgi:hypothetical protein
LLSLLLKLLVNDCVGGSAGMSEPVDLNDEGAGQGKQSDLLSDPNPGLTDAAHRPLHGLCRSSSGSAAQWLPRWPKTIESSPRPHPGNGIRTTHWLTYWQSGAGKWDNSLFEYAAYPAAM